MIAVDTSVVVAAFASWHESHEVAVGALRHQPRIPAHAAVETFSVLTRLPPPHRVPALIAAEYLRVRFSNPHLTLPEPAYRHLIQQAARLGIIGGGIYDALVAATAHHAQARLFSLDSRAASVYERVGVDFEILG